MAAPTSLRSLPKVDRLLGSPELVPLLAAWPRVEVVGAVRAVLAGLRRQAAAGSLAPDCTSPAAVAVAAEAALAVRHQPSYRRVINATGVVLHTGLGRAPLSLAAVEALARTAASAQRLEVDLDTGERGGRDAGCAALLTELTGAQAATVVNNNAAATLLILAALARGKKVVLSRGEMVEIGGSFRIPEVLAESGAALIEVGTTNRTHLADYAAAIDGETGLLLKVHPSNYRIDGFTAEVEIEALAALGRERGVPVAHDLGSGCLVDLSRHGLPGEPLVRRSVAAGTDVVCFSGDKLLGGPQAGILVGRLEAVERCRRHPLYRALRPGRLIYTALEATLSTYRRGEAAAVAELPVLARLLAAPEDLRRRARRLLRAVTGIPGLAAGLCRCDGMAGSGSLPARPLPGWGVALTPRAGAAGDLAAALRRGDPPILARLVDGAVVLDVRTLEDGDFAAVASRLAELG